MIRTQIQLTEEQARILRELSLSTRESVAALIRKAIDRFLITGKPDRAALYRQAMSVAGKYKTEQPDTSVEHDRYLEEAFRL
ncbi:MAG: ribbon-helix-helix protein, CopG family [Deltaproteobacteria bacterium]|nr:ribbon-helix-helix protein, CopG family [Deltaproteobacteria bacterium]